MCWTGWGKLCKSLGMHEIRIAYFSTRNVIPSYDAYFCATAPEGIREPLTERYPAHYIHLRCWKRHLKVPERAAGGVRGTQHSAFTHGARNGAWRYPSWRSERHPEHCIRLRCTKRHLKVPERAAGGVGGIQHTAFTHGARNGAWRYPSGPLAEKKASCRLYSLTVQETVPEGTRASRWQCVKGPINPVTNPDTVCSHSVMRKYENEGLLNGVDVWERHIIKSESIKFGLYGRQRTPIRGDTTIRLQPQGYQTCCHGRPLSLTSSTFSPWPQLCSRRGGEHNSDNSTCCTADLHALNPLSPCMSRK
jgi:hypothetical protein